MNISRRVFVALLFQRRVETSSISVRVIEIFTQGQTPSAILVHRADDARRDRFAQWLQANPRHWFLKAFSCMAV